LQEEVVYLGSSLGLPPAQARRTTLLSSAQRVLDDTDDIPLIHHSGMTGAAQTSLQSVLDNLNTLDWDLTGGPTEQGAFEGSYLPTPPPMWQRSNAELQLPRPRAVRLALDCYCPACLTVHVL
jgi:hypothetical protein